MHKISILIPTLDNVDYVRLAVASFRQNSIYPIEILVHANNVSEDMKKLAEEMKFDVFTYSTDNKGVAVPANALAKKSTGDIIFYVGDDVYAAPDWDKALVDKMNPKIFYQYLTCCMFEPRYNNPCMNSPLSYGKTTQEFEKERFLKEYKDVRQIKEDIISPWGPVFVTRELWEKIGGFDERYYPGFGTDPDIVAKIYFEARSKNMTSEFRGVADSVLYHFQCISTDRLPNNQQLRATANNIFVHKWGMMPSNLHKLLRAGEKI